MARYADDAKEQVRDRVDFADLVSSKVELQRSGINQLKGLCPFHDERSPSFGINPIDKLYYCFGCGEGGDVFDFVMKTEGMQFKEALEYLADRYGVTLEVQDEDPQAAERRRERERLFELLERTTQYYERYLWESAEAEQARTYLAERGLSTEALKAYRVGFAPAGWDKVLLVTRRAGFSEAELYAAGLVTRSQSNPGRVYDRFRRRIIFPLADTRGRVVGFGARAMSPDEKAKYLNSPESGLFHKGKLLYGAHLARTAAAKAGSVIVTEGYTDVIALHQAGLENAVCIMGTSLTEDQVGELVRLAPRSVLALDADNAGQEAMLRAARVAEGRRLELRVATMPAGQDPAELVQVEGPEAVAAIVAASVPFVRFQVDRLLARGNTEDPEGKDQLIAAIRPVLSAMAPSVLREDLARHVADRLRLSPALAAMLTEPVPGGGGPAEPTLPVADTGAVPDAVGPRQVDRGERVERTFLTLCLALPTAGTEYLALVRPEEHFSTPLLRRTAGYLQAHLAAPTAALPEDDQALVGLVQQMAVRAGQATATPAALRIEYLQLDSARLDRAMATARHEGTGIGALAVERGKLRAELDAAMHEAMEEQPAE